MKEIESEEQRLKDAFDYIKSIYFKSWDKHGEWIIELTPNLAFEKVIVPCSKIEKRPNSPKFQTITIHSIPANQNEIYSLIIHLIAHAASENGHGTPWVLQMLKAARIAKKMNEAELSSLILEDVQPYKAVIENNLYKYIIEFLFEHPYSSYESIIKKVSNKFATSPSTIVREFKSCRAVYIAGRTGAKMQASKKT